MSFDLSVALFAEGDSITAGNHTGNVSYATKMAQSPYAGAFYTVVDNAVGSSTVAIMAARAAALDARLPTGGKKGILTVMAGINDYLMAPAVVLTALASYLDARRAAGWTVVVCTLLPDTADAGANTFRNTMNTTIRTWAGVHADAVCDMGADATMGGDSAPLDTSLYLDGLHPTLLGHTNLAAALWATLATILQKM